MSGKSRRTIGAALGLTLLAAAASVAADDLTITETMTVGGTGFTTRRLVKGPRERTTVDMGAGVSAVTIRQCDLKRSLTVNDSLKTYMVLPDLEELDSSKAAAAAFIGAPAAEPGSGGTVTYTLKATDTGEKKQIFGFTARHMKTSILAQSSPDACNAVNQKYEMDGWYIDMKEQSGCQSFTSYAKVKKDVQGCRDRVVLNQSGTVRPGLPVQETITIANDGEPPAVVTREVMELKKGPLAAELFDAPADYKQVSMNVDLSNIPPAVPQQMPAGAPGISALDVQPQGIPGMPSVAQMMAPAAQLAIRQRMTAQAPPMGIPGAGMLAMNGMSTAAAPQGSAPVAAPQALGPKAAGKIRIGVAPPEAQVEQGSNAGADYSTPIRNVIVALMSGPAVEIAALDSRVPVQLQAEAQQKECDLILYSKVIVKHNSGRFGKFMKMAGPIANVVPVVGMSGSLGSTIAAQAAGAAASAAALSAQQLAVQQLAGFNGQIKSKDDVTVEYQLNPIGQSSPKLQNQLVGKAGSNGEDVLTPLLTQAASAVLTEVTKK